MATRTVSLDLGSGPDEATVNGEIEIQRATPGYASGTTTWVLGAPELVRLGSVPTEIELTVGAYYWFRPRRPSGQEKLALVTAGSGLMLWGDLVAVDPESLSPAADPGPAWLVNLDDLVETIAPAKAKDASDTLQAVTRRTQFIDGANAKGALLAVDHYGDGTNAPGTQAYGFDLHNWPGSKQGVVVHQYSNNGAAVQIDNTDTNDSLFIRNATNLVNNPSSPNGGSGLAIRYEDHGTTRYSLRDTGSQVQVIRSNSTYPGQWIINAAPTIGARIQQSGAQSGLSVESAAGAAGFFAAQISAQDYGLKINAATTGGKILDLQDQATPRFWVNSSGATVIVARSDAAGPGLWITNPSAQRALRIQQSGAQSAVSIEADTAGGADGFYPLDVVGRNYGPRVTTSTNGGQSLRVEKNGTGNGTALYVKNAGTGATMLWTDGANATVGQIDKNGFFMTRKNVAPADADLTAGEVAIWFDSTNGAAKVKFKGKEAGGTVRSGEVALA